MSRELTSYHYKMHYGIYVCMCERMYNLGICKYNILKAQNIHCMNLFLVELFTGVKRFGFYIKPPSG